MTPNQKHSGEDVDILKARKKLLEEAKAKHPGRWVQNKVRNCEPTHQTTLNPVDNREIEQELKRKLLNIA